MNVTPGTSETFLVASATGWVVASFEKRVDLDAWIEARKGNGVNYRIFIQQMTLVELGVRKGRELRLVEG